MARKLLSVLCLLLTTFSAHATVYYVNGGQTNNNGNGQSWANAKKDIQEAINLATVSGDQVWVREGTYLPTLNPNGVATGSVRNKAFYIKAQDIKLYGGFAGTESSITGRIAGSNITTLSGDLDAAGTDDAYHVLVTLNRTIGCVVDGFTITGGLANTGGSFNVITPSTALNQTYGGGMYNDNSSPSVSNCTFSANMANNGGGGMYNEASSSPTVSNCTFSTNTAKTGGGIHNDNSSPAVSSSTFSANTASASGGGGMRNNNGSNTLVTSCTFTANTASGFGGGGGGIYNSSSSPTVSNCIFSTNTASGGGGIYNDNSSPAVSSCLFSGNSATTSGGGLFNGNSSNSVINNCTFTTNTTGGLGGGMYENGGTPSINNCTFTANTASGGGGIYYSNNGGTLVNCVLYGNIGGTANRENIVKNNTTGTLAVSYSLIGDYSAAVNNNYTSGAGIITGDPLFINAANPAGADGIFHTADDGLRLLSCSPAINAGTILSPTLPTDILGNTRVGAYDLGTYEYQSSVTNPVVATATIADTRTLPANSVVVFGGCGNAIASLNSAGTSAVSGAVTAKVYVQTTAPMAGQTPYARRHYDISPATGANTATGQITLYFTQADFTDYNTVGSAVSPLPIDATDAANNKNNIRITQQHGTSVTGLPGSYSGWTGTGPANVLITPSSVAWNASATRWEVTFPVTGFSGFFLTGNISTPLPLRLLNFRARRMTASQNQVAWATGSEDPGAVFTIERSGDGRAFKKIGVMGGVGKASFYSFEDNAPLKGDNYYRLQIQEINAARYSSVARVRGEESISGNMVTVSPVPAIDGVTIRCNHADWYGQEARLVDMNGRIVSQIILAEQVIIDIREWASGVYLLRLPDGSTLRVVKQ